MIVTQADARRIIAAKFPDHAGMRLTTACLCLVRPIYEQAVGMQSLAVRKLATGRDSAVAIGVLDMSGRIDWQADVTI